MFFVGISTSLVTYLATLVLFFGYLLVGSPIQPIQNMSNPILVCEQNVGFTEETPFAKNSTAKKAYAILIKKNFDTSTICCYSYCFGNYLLKKIVILSAGINSPPLFI